MDRQKPVHITFPQLRLRAVTILKEKNIFTEVLNSPRASEISFVVTTTAIGCPLPRGLPQVTMSGITSVEKKYYSAGKNATTIACHEKAGVAHCRESGDQCTIVSNHRRFVKDLEFSQSGWVNSKIHSSQTNLLILYISLH